MIGIRRTQPMLSRLPSFCVVRAQGYTVTTKGPSQSPLGYLGENQRSRGTQLGRASSFTSPYITGNRKSFHGMSSKANNKNAAGDSNGTIKTELSQLSAGKKMATVSFSRPQKLNALNSSILSMLPTTLQNLLDANPDLIAVILTGEGTKAFTGGADIAEMGAISSPTEARAFIKRIHAACQSIRECPVPVIARLNGITLGAGLEIAASCDLRIASSTAILGMPEVRMGLPSVVEAALLPGLIGWGRTRQLLTLAETISAEEAFKWGLVQKVVEPEQLDQAVAGWMGSLEKCGPEAVKNQKVLMRRWEQLGVDAAIDASIDHFGQAFEKPDLNGKNGEAEPVRMMGEFMKQQEERRKSKL